jgi:hypothetical protein
MNTHKYLVSSIRSVDFGKDYGKIGLVHEIAYSHNDEELRPLLDDIARNFADGETISIGDWGGGNGIMSGELRNRLAGHHPKISVIDLDTEKFSENHRYTNI